VIILTLKISSEFKKKLIRHNRGGLAHYFSRGPQKMLTIKRSSEAPIALEAPKLEGPHGKIPPPYMASPANRCSEKNEKLPAIDALENGN
jgi:hypothetical protein